MTESNLLTYKAYTGIGSRETPENILGLMTLVGYKLAQQGWILRSGCAPGADTAFERGAWSALDEEGVVRPELYLPWEGFEGRERWQVARTEPQPEAIEIAAEYHPAWNRLSKAAKRFHSRNVHQILGYDVTRPQLTTFVVCWTRDGKEVGGTAQALRIARGYEIPEVYNLFNKSHRDLIKNFLKES